MSFITNQIKEIRSCAKQIIEDFNNPDDQVALVLNNAAQTIETLSAKIREEQWIPVTWHVITEEERKEGGYPDNWTVLFDCKLPDDGDEILITLRRSNGELFVQGDICYVDDWYTLDSGYDWIDVVAWMPMPEPYKADKDLI